MIKNQCVLKLLKDKTVTIRAGKDDFQRVEVYCPVTDSRIRRFGARMIIGDLTYYIAKDVEPCSRREAIAIYTYLIDELDKDNDVIDLRPVLQNILDKRKEGN